MSSPSSSSSSSSLMLLSSSTPAFEDLVLVPVVAFLFYILRKVVERWMAEPLGIFLGIPPRKTTRIKNFKDNPTLENLFHSYDRSDATLHHLSAKTDLSIRQIESWLRRRRAFADFASKPQLVDKFKESTWFFFLDLVIFLAGVFVLWDKSWAWSLPECWKGWPAQPQEDSIRWFYIVQSGWYLLQICTQFANVRRKDFWQMFIHHIVTLTLVFGSWFTNTVRIGALILVLHDVVDPVLQSTKMATYAKCEFLSTILFALFAFLWLTTRLIFFPLYIIHTCMTDRVDIFVREGLSDGSLGGIESFFQGLIVCLWLLYLLHCIWFYNIIVLIVKLAKGEHVRDTRSEDEGEEEEEKKEENKEEKKEEEEDGQGKECPGHGKRR